jgi:peptidoglycan/xylan/chitin deacetylase (PgdA/CDA1 family)
MMAITLLWGSLAQSASPASLVSHGPVERRWVTLTFDDNTPPGPSIATLQVLRHYKVPAALFLIGWPVDKFPEITQEIASGVVAGLFEVGDHSATHADLSTLSAEGLAGQIGAGTEAFHRATGLPVSTFFRPPYGRTNPLVAQAAGEKGFTHVVLWSTGTEDWTGEPAQVIEDNIVRRAHNGAIILLHMGAPNTAAALPGIITRLRAAGYELVSLSKMLGRDRLFVDVPPDTEVGRAVAVLTSLGFMSGYDQNHFGPSDRLTRRQAAKVVSLVGGLHTEAINNPDTYTFWDVPPTYDEQGNIVPYPYDFVEEAVAAGFIRGSVDEQDRQVFKPDGNITRVQLAQIIARMAQQLKGYPEHPDGTPPSFSDVPEYAAADVNLVARLGLMKGYEDSRFGSWEPAQRGHVAVVMARYLALPMF